MKKKALILEGVVEQPSLKVPWEVWTAFGQAAKEVSFIGNQIALTDDSDFVTIERAREAVQWYVENLGGSVNWK